MAKSKSAASKIPKGKNLEFNTEGWGSRFDNQNHHLFTPLPGVVYAFAFYFGGTIYKPFSTPGPSDAVIAFTNPFKFTFERTNDVPYKIGNRNLTVPAWRLKKPNSSNLYLTWSQGVRNPDRPNTSTSHFAFSRKVITARKCDQIFVLTTIGDNRYYVTMPLGYNSGDGLRSCIFNTGTINNFGDTVFNPSPITLRDHLEKLTYKIPMIVTGVDRTYKPDTK